MSRVILAPNDLLTPFDLRAENFRVNVEFSTCHRGQKNFRKNVPKWPFGSKKKIFARFFWNRPFRTTDDRKNLEKFFSSRRGPIGIFFFGTLYGENSLQ